MLDATTIHITRHAIARYRERTGSTADDARAERRLRRFLEDARPVRRKNSLSALLNHGCREAHYYLYRGNWVLVVAGNALVTTYPLPAGESFTPLAGPHSSRLEGRQ